MPVPMTVRPRRIDPRLLRRTRGSRLALAVDAALGIVAALLVLAQAVLIAHIAARSFDGAGLRALSVPLAALCIVVTARAVAAWGFDVVGRLAAADVLSSLRGDLVRSRLSDTQAGFDVHDDAELAVAAVAGIDALETVFARLLPQLVLAAAVPAAVLALVAAIDPLSALLMLITLPLVPVFMWLIGRTTERRALARWQELSLLSSHFLDVVRGLPTLRAFNRGEAQAERIDQVGERYRKATMETLRLAFLSGAVLDLAATLGVALIAVTVGVRLVEGDIGFAAALTGWWWPVGCWARPRRRPRPWPRRHRFPPRPPSASTGSASAIRGPAGRHSSRSDSSWGRERRWRWSALAAAARAPSRACCCAWRSPATGGSWPAAPTSPPATRINGGEGSRGCRSIQRCFTARSPTTSGWAPRTPRMSSCVTPPRRPAPPSSSRSCRPDTRRRWETAAARCPLGRRSGSH